MSDIDLYLERERFRVNRALLNLLPTEGPPAVIEAMRYSLEAGGKRLRPLLVLATAETLGSIGSSTLDVACALELVHTYSLIHDDLPAMDDSPLRRGKPSCHLVHGEAIALLAGDALLTLAFEVLAAYGVKTGKAEAALGMVFEVASAAGTGGMIGGQVLDLEAEGKPLDPGGIDRIESMKTGALLKAAVTCGALAAGANPDQVAALSVYALKIGAAFQVVDDLLDLRGSPEELGKPVGTDRERSKATYPALLGEAGAEEKAHELYREALSALEGLGRPADLLVGLAGKMVFRRK